MKIEQVSDLKSRVSEDPVSEPVRHQMCVLRLPVQKAAAGQRRATAPQLSPVRLCVLRLPVQKAAADE